MGKFLDQVLDAYAKTCIPDPRENEIEMLEEGLRSRIVEEICAEEASRIEAETRRRELSRRAEEYGSEISKLILEAVVLVVVLGLFVNVAFEWLSINLFSVDGAIDATRLQVALIVLIIVAIAVVSVIALRGVAALVRSFNAIRNKGER